MQLRLELLQQLVIVLFLLNLLEVLLLLNLLLQELRLLLQLKQLLLLGTLARRLMLALNWIKEADLVVGHEGLHHLLRVLFLHLQVSLAVLSCLLQLLLLLLNLSLELIDLVLLLELSNLLIYGPDLLVKEHLLLLLQILNLNLILQVVGRKVIVLLALELVRGHFQRVWLGLVLASGQIRSGVRGRVGGQLRAHVLSGLELAQRRVGLRLELVLNLLLRVLDFLHHLLQQLQVLLLQSQSVYLLAVLVRVHGH